MSAGVAAVSASVLIFEIGATNVGSVVHTSAPGTEVAKGAEKGYFQFGGSAIATVRALPFRLMGITICFWAISAGTNLITVESISKWARLMEGTPYCLLKKLVMSSSLR